MSGTHEAAVPNDLYLDAELYDRIYAEYHEDLAFYVAAAKAAGGPVLEAACGTGRVLLPTLAAGVDIEGFDHAPAMIARLRSKAAARGLEVRATVADMRTLDLGRHYALITIPFRAFMHLLTTEDQLQALERLRAHLSPGGAIVFNVFYPSFAKIAEWDGRRVLERVIRDPESGASLEVWTEAHYDRVQQSIVATREIVPLAPGAPAGRRHHFELRWSYRFEIELLLRATGFSRYDVRGGFDGRTLERDTDEMVWTAYR